MTSPLAAIPVAPGRLPGIGHGLAMRRDPLAFLSSLAQYGPLVRIYLGPRPVVVAATPDLARHVLVTDAKSFHKGRLFDKIRPVMGNGLMTSNGRFHRQQRRLIQPAFHRERVAGYIDVMSSLARDLADTFEDGQTVDVRAELNDTMITILGRTLFATELGSAATRQAQASMPVLQDTIARRTMSPIPFLEKLPTPANRRFEQATAQMRGILDRVIDEYRQEGVDRGDLLSLLIAARDENGEAMPAEQIRDELVTIFAAGMDTTSDTVAWALYEFGQHPDLQERAYEEVHRAVGAEAVTATDVPQMLFLQHAVKEVLRVHPPANLLMRKAITDVELDGIRLPAGTEVMTSPLLFHHDPALYPDPDRFDPDRWGRPETTAMPRTAYLPFGAGARQCIGDVFTTTQAVVVMATLLARWRLEPAPGHVVQPIHGVTVSPGKVLMTLHARS
ncbi:cytochrome P450 [Kitasatospora sp. NPDC088783]|uniref:cytochrome P450 n=1 Tax=Kitasatospora sp. NPDC088783 TaxID=3364077 RepID=UPI0037F6D16F